MKNTSINLYDKSGAVVSCKLKPFMSAQMVVELTRILRKYSELYTNFIDRMDNIEDMQNVMSLDDGDYIRAKRLVDMMAEIGDDKQTAMKMVFSSVYVLYRDEINKEIVPLIVDVTAISNKSLLEMLREPDNELWEKQDLYSFRAVCAEYYL